MQFFFYKRRKLLWDFSFINKRSYSYLPCKDLESFEIFILIEYLDEFCCLYEYINSLQQTGCCLVRLAKVLVKQEVKFLSEKKKSNHLHSMIENE